MLTQEQLQARKSGTARVFDRAAATYDQVGPRFFSYFGRKMVEQTPIKAGAKVLDVATGRGAVLGPLIEKVGTQGQIIAIDLSDEMVRLAQAEVAEKKLENVQILKMDAEQLDFAEASFEAVLCGFGLSFLPQISQALAEFHRVLKPGGVMAASIWGEQDSRWDWFVEAGLRPAPQPGGKQKMHEGKTDWLEETLAQAKFENIRVIAEEVDLTFASPEEWWATEWSHGARGCLERLEPAALEKAKETAFARLEAMREADGIHHIYRAVFLLANKS